MKSLYKRAKVDIGLVPQALNNNNNSPSTGKYFPMHMFNKALFWLLGGAMDATKTTSIEIWQAKDANGTDAKAITNANATIKANTAVTAAKLTLSGTVQANDTVTINGVVFTAAAAANAAEQIFAVGADNDACAASLAEVINAAGLGIKATNSSEVVTVVAEDDATITITSTSGAITVATTEAKAFVEVDVGSLDLADGYEYVAAKVSTTANTVVSVTLIRGDARFEPGQDVAASKSV